MLDFERTCCLSVTVALMLGDVSRILAPGLGLRSLIAGTLLFAHEPPPATAAWALTIPKPKSWSFPVAPRSVAVASRRLRISDAVRPWEASSPATPATNGEAMLVPQSLAYPPTFV